jgi:hypothetical protein
VRSGALGGRSPYTRMFVAYIYIYIYIYIFEGAVCRTAVVIVSYEAQVKSLSQWPDILLSDLRSAITTSRKSGKIEKPVLEFRCCTSKRFAELCMYTSKRFAQAFIA